jgi:adenylate kinase
VYIVLIGAPGAGKGTQAQALHDELDLAHVASGDMFRDAMARRTLRGLQAKRYYDQGELVPDDLTVAMVGERLEQADCAKGAILDGFPRNLAQAQTLDRTLAEDGRAVGQALYLSVPGDELLRRLSGRWLCRQCQTPYHEVYEPPKQQGRCDRCGGEHYQREDDKSETARHRLEVYFEQTTPVIQYYRDRGLLDELDGAREIGAVRETVIHSVRRRMGVV